MRVPPRRRHPAQCFVQSMSQATRCPQQLFSFRYKSPVRISSLHAMLFTEEPRDSCRLSFRSDVDDDCRSRLEKLVLRITSDAAMESQTCQSRHYLHGPPDTSPCSSARRADELVTTLGMIGTSKRQPSHAAPSELQARNEKYRSTLHI